MWYVYYLHCAATGQLLYIGRSDRPKQRQAAFHALHHVLTEMGLKQRHSTFEEACAAEVKAIEKHRPPYNKLTCSSRGALGYRHDAARINRISEAASYPRSEATKLKMSKPKTEETKAKMRKPKSPEHRAKLAAVLKRAAQAKADRRRAN